jgi:hypothetical protein
MYHFVSDETRRVPFLVTLREYAAKDPARPTTLLSACDGDPSHPTSPSAGLEQRANLRSAECGRHTDANRPTAVAQGVRGPVCCIPSTCGTRGAAAWLRQKPPRTLIYETFVDPRLRALTGVGAWAEGSGYGRPAAELPAAPAARAAGRGLARAGHRLVPAPGRRGQVGQDGAGLHLRSPLVRRRLPAQPGRKDQLGPGGRPRHPAVDGAPAGSVQQRVRQHPVPGAAAVLQVARRRGRLPQPDDPAAGAEGHRHGGPGIHQR